MVNEVILGLATALLAGLLTCTISLILYWEKRPREFGPPDQLTSVEWKLRVYSATLLGWPIVSILTALLIATIFGTSIVRLVFWSLAVPIATAVVLSVIQRLRDRSKINQTQQVSRETERALVEKICKQWTRTYGDTGCPKVEVVAYRTPMGIRGSVTVWVPTTKNISPELYANIASVVPPQLHLTIEPR